MSADIKSYWQNYIGGAWVDGARGARIPVEDPATGKVIAEIARAEPADVDRAVAAARACVDSRALTDIRPGDRGRMLLEVSRILRRRHEEIARLVCFDSGKNISQARMEAESTARYFEYYGGLADKIEGSYIPLGGDYVDYVVPVPYGVTAHIIPWNYPVEMAARSGAAALAAGNAVVIKSAELDPLSVCLLAEACEEAGLPKGAVNVICGYGEDAGAALSAHADVDQIVFTGSVETGQAILRAAANTVVPCVMELGGKSAGIVFPDANLEAVTESTRWGIYLNSGQVCSAMSRLLVHRSMRKKVVDSIVAMSETLTIGPGIEDHFITPLISADQLDRVESYCHSGVQQGAKAIIGGRRADRKAGYFMKPTIFTDVRPDMKIAREEIFGPVISVIEFETEAEAIEIANGTDYGLVAGVFTSDLDRAHHMADRLIAGQIFVNEWFAGGNETPFGGMKKSGFGREKGQDAIMNYYQSKNVGIRKLIRQ